MLLSFEQWQGATLHWSDRDTRARLIIMGCPVCCLQWYLRCVAWYEGHETYLLLVRRNMKRLQSSQKLISVTLFIYYLCNSMYKRCTLLCLVVLSFSLLIFQTGLWSSNWVWHSLFQTYNWWNFTRAGFVDSAGGIICHKNIKVFLLLDCSLL